jgi:hypothetical protein
MSMPSVIESPRGMMRTPPKDSAWAGPEFTAIAVRAKVAPVAAVSHLIPVRIVHASG